MSKLHKNDSLMPGVREGDRFRNQVYVSFVLLKIDAFVKHINLFFAVVWTTSDGEKESPAWAGINAPPPPPGVRGSRWSGLPASRVRTARPDAARPACAAPALILAASSVGEKGLTT